MGKTVFFGGTFNPPHIAHRLMLEAVAKMDDVEKILVIPTNIPPHKGFYGFTASGDDRLSMCKLLSEGINKAEVSDMELKRGGKSYSFDTLSMLKPKHPELSMLIGGDMVTSFTTWFRYRDIFDLCEIIAVRRQGVDNEEFLSAVEQLNTEGAKISVIDVSLPLVSSTELREILKIRDCGSNSLIPQNIFQFIKNKGLYVID